MKRAVIYARVSTKRQGEKGGGLAVQVKNCRDYAAANGYTAVAVFEDTHTGDDFERPGLDDLMIFVKRERIDAVIVTNTDRLARKRVNADLIEDELNEMGIKVEFIDEGFAENDEGELFKDIKKAIAQYDKRKILRRLKAGKTERVTGKKKLMGGYQAPYGYDYNVTTGNLSINEAEARIVRLMFEWYVLGDAEQGPLSSQEIARRLSAMGTPRRGNGSIKFTSRWPGNIVCVMLANETYIGDWYFNKTRSERRLDPETKKYKTYHGIKRQREEWIGPVAVPAIITRELFEAAQERAKRNRDFSSRNRKYLYLYGNVMKCDHCGYSISGMQVRGDHYYRCHGRRVPEVQCNLPHINERDLHAVIWPWFAGLLDDPDEVVNAIKQQEATRADSLQPLKARLAQAEQQIALLGKRIANLDDELEIETDAENRTSLRERKAMRTKERKEYEQERDELTKRLAVQIVSAEQLEEMRAIVQKYRNKLHNATPEQQRQLYLTFGLTARLAVEGDEKIAYVTCMLGEERLNCGSVNKTTMIYTHVLNRGGRGVRSPLD